MFSVIFSEYLSSQISGLIMSFSNSFYPLSGILLSIYFMTINNWRLFFVITSIISIITSYYILIYFPESPRWLFVKGKIKESIKTLEEIAKINGNYKEWETYLKMNNLEKTLNEKNKNNNKENNNKFHISIFEILSFKSQRKTLIILIITWYGVSFCFYGIVLNLRRIKTNFFLQSILAFLGEMCSELSSGYISNIYGRVIILKYGGIIGSISFILYKISSDFFKSVFIFISMFGYAATFNVIFIYTSEILPTPIRATVCEILFLINSIVYI